MSSTTAAILASTLLLATAAWAAEAREQEVAELKARPFDLKEVRLLDGPFRDAMERDRRYLHAIDADRLSLLLLEAPCLP